MLDLFDTSAVYGLWYLVTRFVVLMVARSDYQERGEINDQVYTVFVPVVGDFPLVFMGIFGPILFAGETIEKLIKAETPKFEWGGKEPVEQDGNLSKAEIEGNLSRVDNSLT